MEIFNVITDPYNRRARLTPSLLALLPIILLTVLVFPDFENQYASVVGLFVTCGGTVLLTQIGRDRGKRYEKKLNNEWGGKPSVAMLRHSDNRMGRPLKSLIHQFLNDNIIGLNIPTAEEEALAPGAADDTYEAATRWLLAKTRDKTKFRLLFEENMNYGFRRNYWALKPFIVGVDIVLAALVVCFFGDLLKNHTLEALFNTLPTAAYFYVSIPTIHIIITLAVATKSWVRITSEAYARQLLEACAGFDTSPN